MSAAPREILASAQKIRDSQKDEAGHRAAISRSYYAAYHAARIFHDSLGSPGSVGGEGGVHAQLVARLLIPTIPSTDPKHLISRRVGYMLRDMHRSRITADYEIDAVVIDADAESTMRKGADVITMCTPPVPVVAAAT